MWDNQNNNNNNNATIRKGLFAINKTEVITNKNLSAVKETNPSSFYSRETLITTIFFHWDNIENWIASTIKINGYKGLIYIIRFIQNKISKKLRT